MTKRYTCRAVGLKDVRLVAVDEQKRVSAVMLYDLRPEEVERFTVGRKYELWIEEAEDGE